MPFRSAIYYPHTEVHDENLLKTALLLWDSLHFIVPFSHFEPSYASRDLQEAFELIGNCRTPSDEERNRAHELVEDFVTRPLPAGFSVFPVGVEHSIYPQKFMPETWEMLRQTRLTRPAQLSSGSSMSEPTALVLMSLLTDCCAGTTLARVTDRCDAYASLTGLFVESEEARDVEVAREQLVPIPLQVADAERLSLKKLIAFRKREKRGADGHFIRDLRHRFQDRLSDHARTLAATSTPGDREELKRQFEASMKDDYQALREALKLEAKQLLGSKEILISVLVAVGAIASPLSTIAVPPLVSGGAGGILTLGGLIAAKSKFVETRQKVLREHPMAYVYEACGGLRL